MVQAVLIVLGLFVIFGVAYNILAIRRRQPKSAKNTLFKAEPAIKTVALPEQAPADLNEPLIDEALHAADFEASAPGRAPEASTLVSIYVMASAEEAEFSPDDLIPAMAAVDCHFGEMSIFHRHEQLNGQGKILFSLAQATQPGIFNLDDLASIQCHGLVFFMDAAMMDDPYAVFNLMLEAAERIAQDLNGALHEAPNQPMTQSSQAHYEHQLRYAKAERDRLKETV